MTCSDGPFELLTRPYPYKRQPFQLGSGELVTYEGVYFSIPASSLLLEKRLFTDELSHPVSSTIQLYVNKDAGLSAIIEPDDDGAVYTSGTPHYADYVLDLRSLIDDVTQLHAADSDHTAKQFLEEHLTNARSTYDLSSVGTPVSEYVHPEPANVVPSGATPPGASGSIPPPGDGHELGAQQIMDVDVDEVQWQPIARPKNYATTDPADLPVEPVFPMVLDGGSLPTITSLDDQNLTDLALNGAASGGLLVTGDGLLAGTSIKVTSTSGATPEGEGLFSQAISWKRFPCNEELCTYYTPHQGSGALNALGRQATYVAPGSLSEGVYMLIASDATDTSGSIVQHWPGNYNGLSGIDINGHGHRGMHVVDRLIYNLNASNGGVSIGFSPINGQEVFGHWVGTETGSEGEQFATSGPTYQNGDTCYSAGNITVPATAGFAGSQQNWATVGNTLSPVSWANLFTSALQPFRGLFGARNGVTYAVADIQAGSTRGVITRKVYAGWGFIDQIVAPDLDRAQGGQRQESVITYTTLTYEEGTNALGEFEWQLIGTTTSTQTVVFYQDTYGVNNIFSFFFLRKVTHGLVHANGNIYVQWSDRLFGVPVEPQNKFFASIGNPVTKLVPSTSRSSAVSSIGFFPSWKLILTVTTNNQVTVPDSITLSPAGSAVISFAAALDFDTSTITEYGPVVWDDVAGVNYIWFQATQLGVSKTFFAHMDTSFEIFRINQTNGEGIFSGRPAVLSL